MTTENYRGYTIEVSREKCLGGWEMTYYSIFRDSDGFECVSNFSEGCDTIEEWIDILKERIDNEHKENDPWDESAIWGPEPAQSPS